MVNFHIISIFPKLVEEYCSESIIKRGQAAGLFQVRTHDLRKWSVLRHSKVDDKPYAGGPGMLMAAEPILRCVQDIKDEVSKSSIKKPKFKIILFKPAGDKFNNNIARDYSRKFTDIILICGRYEGIDSRVEKILKPEILSIGDYVLTGGEIPAMVVIDSVSRQIKGVLGDENSLEENRGYRDEFYTRPEVLIWKNKKYKVPEILLSGDHKKIDEWKKSK